VSCWGGRVLQVIYCVDGLTGDALMTYLRHRQAADRGERRLRRLCHSVSLHPTSGHVPSAHKPTHKSIPPRHRTHRAHHVNAPTAPPRPPCHCVPVPKAGACAGRSALSQPAPGFDLTPLRPTFRYVTLRYVTSAVEYFGKLCFGRNERLVANRQNLLCLVYAKVWHDA
jgi:hypothetical protein